ncbi:unnamed protein product, partial [Scytosiphon promiscuus]
GVLTFEEEATFARNEVRTDDSTDQGMGGAISNIGSGSIVFKGKLVMEENKAEGFFEGLGGAIYNRGDIVVEAESEFHTNEASDGGAIFQTAIGTMVFNSMATFTYNVVSSMHGGAIYNV